MRSVAIGQQCSIEHPAYRHAVDVSGFDAEADEPAVNTSMTTMTNDCAVGSIRSVTGRRSKDCLELRMRPQPRRAIAPSAGR